MDYHRKWVNISLYEIIITGAFVYSQLTVQMLIVQWTDTGDNEIVLSILDIVSGVLDIWVAVELEFRSMAKTSGRAILLSRKTNIYNIVLL